MLRLKPLERVIDAFVQSDNVGVCLGHAIDAASRMDASWPDSLQVLKSLETVTKQASSHAVEAAAESKQLNARISKARAEAELLRDQLNVWAARQIRIVARMVLARQKIQDERARLGKCIVAAMSIQKVWRKHKAEARIREAERQKRIKQQQEAEKARAREEAVKLCQTLKRDPESVAGQDVGTAVALLSSQHVRAREWSARALCHLSSKPGTQGVEIKDTIVNAGALPPLVELLASVDKTGAQHTAVGAAVEALRNLATVPWRKSAVTKANAIPYLVRLCDVQPSDTPGHKVQEQAAGALRNLSTLPENKVEIARAGGIRSLLQALNSRNSDTQAVAAAALRNLAINAGNKVAIAKSGGLQQLKAHLRIGGFSLLMRRDEGLTNEDYSAVSALREIVGALRSLVTNNEENKAALASDDGVQLLVDLLAKCPDVVDDRITTLRSEIADTLGALSTSPEIRYDIARAEAIQPLVGLLQPQFKKAHESAAFALRNLAIDLKENQIDIARAGGITSLLLLVESGQAQEEVCYALRVLAIPLENKAYIAKMGGIPILVRALSSASLPIKRNIVGVLRNLSAESPENRELIASIGAIGDLVELLSSDDNQLQAEVTRCLAMLAETEANRGLIEGMIKQHQEYVNKKTLSGASNCFGGN